MTIISFLLFTALASGLTWFLTRKDESQSSDGFFLGGRSLTFPIIAGSLLLTNLSTEQMVGLNGSAYAHGLSVMACQRALAGNQAKGRLRGRLHKQPEG